MISAEITRARPIGQDEILISWKFSQSLEDFRDYIFELQRSESSDSGYTTIFQFNHDTQYVDTIWYRKIWRSLFYRIVATQRSTSISAESTPHKLESLPNLEALEIVRRNNILLKNKRHGIGTPVAVFNLKTLGPKCLCWDVDKQRSRTSRCDDCFGSHIEGGYYAPIIGWANMTPDHKLVQLPQWGEMEPNEARIFFSNYPCLNPKDVIFNPDKMMFYTVEKVETSERRGFMLHQIVSASCLDRGHVVYLLLGKYPELINELSSARDSIRNA